MRDWLDVLKAECKQTSQTKVARRLRLSQTALSQVLKGTYPAKSSNIEARVRGELMNQTIACPVLGEISMRRCQDAQRRPFAATNPQRVALFRACRHECPHTGGDR